MVFAMDSWYTYTIIIGARNQHTANGAYEFHIHRAYIIYAQICTCTDWFLAGPGLAMPLIGTALQYLILEVL